MDCLDRTNVVQSVICRQYLLTWLIKLGIVTKSKSSMGAFERLPDHLEEIFRNQWTKNADVISILYSGTPAMKTDFTQTGKRTWKGAMKDGHSAVKRFFLGNFYDNKDQVNIFSNIGLYRF
jgi:phosphatidylinositol 4-phosphatase